MQRHIGRAGEVFEADEFAGGVGPSNRLAAPLWALRFSWRQEARGAEESRQFVSVPCTMPTG